ncbi:hypothetical protein [Pontimicrobium sp. IMCC45349]|jgi:anti-anti-sigma regulatory factor|uniref:hypothetical protein n=1 Tax=Pontimicrobium sp. IMCC45349 TaxID=3391574 RepID=UPI0039A39E39
MDLSITGYNNYFKIKGVLNKNNVSLFQREFSNIFDKVDSLTLSIEDLESIDRQGIIALAKLHNLSVSLEKRLSIIGSGCDKLFHHFKSSEAA